MLNSLIFSFNLLGIGDHLVKRIAEQFIRSRNFTVFLVDSVIIRNAGKLLYSIESNIVAIGTRVYNRNNRIFTTGICFSIIEGDRLDLIYLGSIDSKVRTHLGLAVGLGLGDQKICILIGSNLNALLGIIQ